MWPFSKKEKKPSWQSQQWPILQEFTEKTGGKFTYLGVPHAIVSHLRFRPRLGPAPGLVCHMTTQKGIVDVEYNMVEVKSIMKHAVYSEHS